jgi:hypothetical protein
VALARGRAAQAPAGVANATTAPPMTMSPNKEAAAAQARRVLIN